ncbi:hypothetical protein [Brumimicrobium mesophilum]|uniref:hypothetical protein n=1 Tax=Brumimicrobium mesophilum TaxID=392717 RepID=UPI000D14213B|nr:hypothetical protein [Brumimicrobium mesophilum]
MDNTKDAPKKFDLIHEIASALDCGMDCDYNSKLTDSAIVILLMVKNKNMICATYQNKNNLTRVVCMIKVLEVLEVSVN